MYKKCIPYLTTGACYDFFYPSTDNSKNHKGGISNVKYSYNTFQNSFVLVSGPYLP